MSNHAIANAQSAGRTVWLVGSRFDSVWFLGSVLIVPAVLFAVRFGAPSAWIDAGVTALVGGPHLFSTFTHTAAYGPYRRSNRVLLLSVLAIPVAVVFLSLRNYPLLITLFLSAASLHVLHQCAYLSDCYRARAGSSADRWSRFLDYGVLFSSMYPLALRQMVLGEFQMSGVQIRIPQPLNRMATAWLATVVFSGFLAAWLAKAWSDHRRGELLVPKTVLIAATIVVSFAVPGLFGRERISLAFQAVNAWHSFQYLGLVWWINTLRLDQGTLDNRFVAALSGKAGAWRFYAWNAAITLVLMIVVRAVIAWNPLGISGSQYYFMFVLSPLLIHYALDAYHFATGVRDVVPGAPRATTTAWAAAVRQRA